MKIFSHLFMLCMMLAICSNLSAQSVTIEGITYKPIDNNKAALAECTSKAQSIVIPSEVKIGNKNYTVTCIDYNSFWYLSTLQEITFPETIDSIGTNAFESCTALQKIVFPKSLKVLQGFAFDNCTSLTSVTLPDDPTMIDGHVFENCDKIATIVANQTDPIVIFDTSFSDYVHKHARLIVPNGCADKYRNTKGWDLFENIEEATTGIDAISADKSADSNSSAAYNLAGQKVSDGYKGIVIKNEKKILVK